MQTVIIAGGAGFIGSHLVESLLKDNFKVLCFDNLMTGSRKNVEQFLENPNFKFIEQDIVKPFGFDEKVDFIFHLASPASPNKTNKKSYINLPMETLLANSLGTYNLLELARKMNARFLFASTSEIYGDPVVSPQDEKYFGNVNPTGVRSVYDEGKRFSEAMTKAYFRKFNLDIRIARIFNTYGPKMPDDGRIIINFLFQAFSGKPVTVYGNGMQTRSFCYVLDLVEGLKSLMFEKDVKGEVVNLGNPQEFTVLEIANKILEFTDSKSKIVFEELPEDDPRKRRPDISKAKKLLGWEPKIPLEEGLRKTIEFFKKTK